MARITILSSLAQAAIFSTLACGYLLQVPLSPAFPHDFRETWTDACSISKSTAFEIFDGENEFLTSPSDDINASKIKPGINSTNWEQWEFDAMSPTGLSEILMAFSRDPSYAFFGQGNLRVEFYIMLADGTIIQELDYVDESYIIECPEFTAGIFNSTDKSYSFHISKDNQYAKLKFDSWRVRGGFTLASSTPPHHADGSAWDPEAKDLGDTELAPGLHYSLPIGGGEAIVDATLSSGRRIAFTGRGGSTRLWASVGWLGLCETWTVIRAYAGPYTIVFWHLVSRVDKGARYISGHLFHHDELLVGSKLGNESETRDFVKYTDLFDGEIHGSYKDKNTGHRLEYVSPSRGKSYSFDVQHMIKQYEMGAGGGFGMTGFADRVIGGEVGGLQYEGRGNGEQTLWPEYIEQWKIWLVYGAGFLGKGKTYALKIVSHFL